MRISDLQPTVLQDVVTSKHLARALMGSDLPDGMELPARRVLGSTLRRFLVPPHMRVIKLMYQPDEPLPEGVEHIVDTVLKAVCAELGLDEQPAGARARLRLRFMRGAKGKQFHRNADLNTNAILLLEGEQEWHFLPNKPAIDKVFGAYEDYSKYCGFRSEEMGTALPTPATLDKLATLLTEAGEESTIKKLNVKAGDVILFNGTWWHATQHLTDEVTNVQIALNGDEINARPAKEADRSVLRPRGRYTAMLWPAKDRNPA